MDRFEIWENIYQDAVSKVKVVKGWDRKLKVPVALKIRSGEDPRMLQVYEHEAETHADLDHPNVCRFFTSFVQNTGKEHQFVIAMELVSTDLNKEIERRWPNTHWSEAQLWRFLTQATEALCYLQEKVTTQVASLSQRHQASQLVS
jgi:serine/threonine protein kinase